MKRKDLAFTLLHTKNLNIPASDEIEATVPGAVQLDYGKYFGYGDYWFGLNFKDYEWMEDEYFIYRSTLDFECSALECAMLCFDGIDYRYIIKIGGKTMASGQGMFTPVHIDVTRFSGRATELEVILFPIPKRQGAPKGRAQAKASCKPASSYGWDWHPRLVPTGIWKDAYVKIFPIGSPYDLECGYRLSDDLCEAYVDISVEVCGCGCFEASVSDDKGNVCAYEKREVGEKQRETFRLKVDAPELWYPRGYGEQPMYTVKVKGCDTVSRRIGFRRSRLVENTGAHVYTQGFPKGPEPAPMTLEINGKRIFAKGSNWVNTEIFPSLMTEKRYDELIDLACDANMNIFRMWGGQFINHDHFYQRCDEKGIMIWQEFMLSCNDHPDEDDYLAVLKSEATTIIKSLRTHPCVVMWCGGNELFNAWSGMTQQSHALRLLDSLCYEHDRFTPFNMTSPLHGVGHGSYVKAVFPDEQRRKGDYSNGTEFLSYVKKSESTAYTEFGCNGGATKDYILKYIMKEDDYKDCNAKNEIWVAHHAFDAWNESCWLGIPEVIYFFGGYDDTDDLIEKSIYLQDMCYKSMFEEMRRKWPLCSMAINWDFNEPWPCAAGNSLVSWPAHPKSALKSVKEALAPRLLSLSSEKNRYLTGDTFRGAVWALNDTDEDMEEQQASVYLTVGDERKLLKTVKTGAVKARSVIKGEEFSFIIDESVGQRFSIQIECAGEKQYSSVYNFVHKQ